MLPSHRSTSARRHRRQRRKQQEAMKHALRAAGGAAGGADPSAQAVPAITRLCALTRDCGKGGRLRQGAIEKICELLNRITEEDVALARHKQALARAGERWSPASSTEASAMCDENDDDGQDGKERAAYNNSEGSDHEVIAPISYCIILESPDVEISMFAMQQGAVIPLHDHPNMFVMTKVLAGELEVESLDFVDPDRRRVSERRARKYVTSRLNKETPASVLQPEHRNIHCFRAATDVAFLDVVLPPYSPSNGRPCNYYEVVKEEGGLLCLRLVPEPESFRPAEFIYNGPR
jgi:cysteamine dioxygenase